MSAVNSSGRLQELLDRQDIHDCLLRFCKGMDRFDREQYLSAFWDDAEMAAGPYVGDVPGCWDWAMPMHRDGQVLTHHLLLNHHVDIDGDSAHSEMLLPVRRAQPSVGRRRRGNGDARGRSLYRPAWSGVRESGGLRFAPTSSNGAACNPRCRRPFPMCRGSATTACRRATKAIRAISGLW